MGVMMANLSMIWRLMRGQRLRYGAAIAALVIASCFLYLVPLVPQVVLDGVLSAHPERASGFVQRLVALGGGRAYLRGHLWLAAVAVLLFTAASGVFTYLRGRWSAGAAERIARRVRDRLYDQLQQVPVSFYDRAETGDLVQRCTSDVETLRQFLATQVVEIGRAAVMMLVPVPLMLVLDARMTLLAVVLTPPIVIFALLFFRRVQSSFKLVDEAEGRLTSTLQENLTGIRVVRAFARQQFERARFADRNGTHRDLDFRLYVLMGWYWSISDLLCMGQQGLVLAAGGFWLLRGELEVGTFYFFLAAVNMFIWPVRMMGRILTQLGKAMVATGRIGEILEHPRESGPRAGAAQTEEAPATLSAAASRAGEIVFDHVSFAHGAVDVLEDVSFRVAAGETLALLGPSGAGKSTIVNLLARFYDPDTGVIRLDGRDLATIDRRAMRAEIALVMQEPFLYSKTVGENIRLGRSSAPDEEIRRAASLACVHDAIEAFDQGYHTLVGERGVTLSGGQRQRIALARALLHEPTLLILDDALSAVDTGTEAMIIDALRERRHRHTTLVIAHRLSTLAHADRILVLERGRVVQQGTHASLLAAGGLYRRLWSIQSAAQQEPGDGRRAAAAGR